MTVGNNLAYQGWQSAIVIGKQETSTTFVTAGAFIEFNSESIKSEREEIKLPSINTTRDFHKRLIGNEAIAGSIEADLNANNDGIINIIKQAMGGSVTTIAHVSSAAAFTHTLITGDMENNSSSGTEHMQSLSIGVRKGSANTFQIAGCRVNTLNIKAEVGSQAVMTAEIIGQSVTNHTSIGAAAISFNNDLPVNFTGVTINTGATTASLTEEFFTAFELEIGNNLDGDQRALGSRNIIAPGAFPGKRDITLKLTQRFDTLTAHDRFLENSLTSVSITLDNGQTMTGASVTNSIVISLPQCFWNSNTPEVGDNGVLVHEIEVSSIFDSTAAYSVQMTVNNGTATYV